MSIRTYPNKQVTETDPIFTGNIEQSVSTSTTKVPSSALLKTTKDTLDSAVALRELLSNKSTDVLLGTSDTQYPSQNAVKTYVDNLLQGLKWKESVRLASTTNGTFTTAFVNGQVLDGVTLVTGDRILLKNQSTGSQNGIYTVNSSGAPTRAVDADSNTEMLCATVYVDQGTTNADSVWACSTNSISLGSTSLTFVQLAGSGLLATKQDTLVSGTNIKTFGGASILGSGDIPVGSAINFTYGETITAGNLVELRSDGKVYKINAVTLGLNQTSPYDSAIYGVFADGTNNKVFAWGKNASGGTRIRCGSLSGATVTWGTVIYLYGSNSATVPTRTRMLYMPTQSCYITASTSDSGNGVELQGYTVSGNTMTKVGSETVINEGVAVSEVQIEVISSSLIALFYNSNGTVKFRTVSVSSGTLTLNSVTSGGNNPAFMCWNSVESRLYVGASSYIYNYSLSGTTLSLSQGNYATYASYANNTLIALFYHSILGKTIALVTSNIGLPSYCILNAETVSTTNDLITLAPLYLGSNTNYSIATGDNAISNIFGISELGIYTINAGSDSRHNMYLELIKGFNDTRKIRIGLYNSNTAPFHINKNLAVTWSNIVSLKYHVISGLNLANYFGIANASGVLNESKEVKINGSVYTTSGLTAGANYYVQLDGTYSTTPTGLYLGKAISTTQLLLDI